MADLKPGMAVRDPVTGTQFRLIVRSRRGEATPRWVQQSWGAHDDVNWMRHRAIEAGPDLTDDTTRDALEAPALRERVGLLEIELRHERTLRMAAEAALEQREAELTALRAQDLAGLNRHERG